MTYKIPLEKAMLEERMIELVKNYLEISISTDISDFENVDCHIYSESTADGYDVYICTNQNKHLCRQDGIELLNCVLGVLVYSQLQIFFLLGKFLLTAC